MIAPLYRSIRKIVLVIAVLLLCIWAIIGYRAWREAPLELWHTYVPHEMTVTEIDKTTWQAYLKHEQTLFEEVEHNITARLPVSAASTTNRFYKDSVVYPPSLPTNWNRSYEMPPVGELRGTAVLLHGLTDSPYSLRHIAALYAQNGFHVFGVRLPGHGTAPSGLTAATWEEWIAGTRLAVRTASNPASGSDEQPLPLHIVGFSNGGALAVKYTLDALENEDLALPDRLVLVSPMIGITRFARFAGIAAVPSVFPAFARAAWLDIVPEFNPFKYNSFPVNGARQSYELTATVREQFNRMAQEGTLANMPPVLTFQSVLDYTVSTPAIFSGLYAFLPDNGSELVLYDVNRASKMAPLMSRAALAAMSRIFPRLPQQYTISVFVNESRDSLRMIEKTVPAGSEQMVEHPLEAEYHPGLFSLSHGAIPFPMDDPLYGMTPQEESAEQYGLNLGALFLRGERGALAVRLEALHRTSSNPFFPLMLEQIERYIHADIASATPPEPRKEHATIAAAKAETPEMEEAVRLFLEESEDEHIPYF